MNTALPPIFVPTTECLYLVLTQPDTKLAGNTGLAVTYKHDKQIPLMKGKQTSFSSSSIYAFCFIFIPPLFSLLVFLLLFSLLPPLLLPYLLLFPFYLLLFSLLLFFLLLFFFPLLHLLFILLPILFFL